MVGDPSFFSIAFRADCLAFSREGGLISFKLSISMIGLFVKARLKPTKLPFLVSYSNSVLHVRLTRTIPVSLLLFKCFFLETQCSVRPTDNIEQEEHHFCVSPF